ncbi:MAG: type II toxin-antitoxin system RatA family toxin [Aaplasma endosymbiont of Hyalomma asiaticum]
MDRSRNGLCRGEILKFSAVELFSIVLDVEKYPEFLPWCKDVVIIGKNKEYMDVELIAGFMSMKGKYTSRVQFSKPTKENAGWIEAKSNDGIFKSLYCKWNFVPRGERETLVEFSVDFSFKSSVLQFAFDMVSGAAQLHIARAFRNRAYELLNSK